MSDCYQAKCCPYKHAVNVRQNINQLKGALLVLLFLKGNWGLFPPIKDIHKVGVQFHEAQSYKEYIKLYSTDAGYLSAG